MSYPAKQFYAVGYLGKLEATYNDGTTTPVVGTDGVQLALSSDRTLPVDYRVDYDGTKSYDLAARSPLPILAPSKGYVDGVDVPFHWKGAGAAYSSSVKPNLHNLMMASGMIATGSFGAGSEKWTYTPWDGSANPSSLVSFFYTGAEKWIARGVLCGMSLSGEKGMPPVFTFKHWGVLTIPPTDDLGGAEALTITYPTLTIDPPKTDGLTVVLGNFTAPDVTKVEFDMGFEAPTPRQNVTTSGAHAGFARGITMQPRLRLTLEKTALTGSPFTSASAFDPYSLYAQAQKLTGTTVSVQWGSTQYNRLKLQFNQAQVVAVPKQERNGSISSVTLEIQPYASTPVANDAFQFIAD